MSTVSDILLIGLAAGVGYVVLNKKGSIKESSGGSSEELAPSPTLETPLPETTITPSTKLPVKASFNPAGMTAADLLKKTGIDDPTEEQLATAEKRLNFYSAARKFMKL